VSTTWTRLAAPGLAVTRHACALTAGPLMNRQAATSALECPPDDLALASGRELGEPRQGDTFSELAMPTWRAYRR
jgi:hypothetical protein